VLASRLLKRASIMAFVEQLSETLHLEQVAQQLRGVTGVDVNPHQVLVAGAAIVGGTGEFDLE